MRSIINAACCFVLVSFSIAAMPKNSSSVMSWPDTQIDIASNVSSEYDFFRSVSLFRGRSQYLKDENRFIKIEGDATEDITGYEVVHILGDLKSTVYVEDQAEIVIRKNLAKDAKIYASGIQRIYIGGDFLGSIESTGTVSVIVKGDFKGTLTTGSPSTNVHVVQDFLGVIKPTVPHQGKLVGVKIEGQSFLKFIEPICKQTYVELEISVGILDLEKGIHTCGSEHRLVVESAG